MIRTLKPLILASLILFIWGCSVNTPSNDKEIKKEKLEEYNNQMNKLKEKIAEMEAEMGDDMPVNTVNVELSQLKPVLFEQFIEALGSVSTDQNIIVSPESAGIIRTIEIKEGDNVQKGQILAHLNTESIEQSLAEVEVNLQLATTVYERRKNLWEQNIGSEMEYLQAESDMKALEKKLQNLEAQLSMAVIKAPIKGVVDKLMQKQGEMAGQAIPFARIVNLDQVYITADVSEKYLNKIQPGDSLSIHFNSLEVEKKGTVFRTSSIIDKDSRTFSIRVNLNNKDHQLLPNLTGELKMKILSVPNALVVPSLLIKKDFNGEFIFVADKTENDSWVAQKRYITTSIKDNNNTVVSEGLNAGDLIITKGFAQVTDGTLLKRN